MSSSFVMQLHCLTLHTSLLGSSLLAQFYVFDNSNGIIVHFYSIPKSAN